LNSNGTLLFPKDDARAHICGLAQSGQAAMRLAIFSLRCTGGLLKRLIRDLKEAKALLDELAA